MFSPLLGLGVMLAAMHATPPLLDLVEPPRAPEIATIDDEPATVLSVCGQIRELAVYAMEARQAGASLGEYLNALDLDDSPAGRYAYAVTVTAWNEPAWHGEERQADAIRRYGVEAEVACIAVLSEARGEPL